MFGRKVSKIFHAVFQHIHVIYVQVLFSEISAVICNYFKISTGGKYY